MNNYAYTISNFVFLAAIFASMYFIVLRPQIKKQQSHNKLLDRLQVEDEVITVGGILGIIKSIELQSIVLQISSNCIISIQKASIVQVLPRDTIKFTNE